MRYIDADKLKAHYAWWNNEDKETFDEIVDAQPTANVRENVRAFWKRNKANTVQCTHCKCCWVDHIGLFDSFNFCPNCGADMRDPIGEREVLQAMEKLTIRKGGNNEK